MERELEFMTLATLACAVAIGSAVLGAAGALVGIGLGVSDWGMAAIAVLAMVAFWCGLGGLAGWIRFAERVR